MPAIAVFYGIIIKMFFRNAEHNPPHFHALYGEYMGSFDIETLEMTEGDMPVRAQKLIREWAKLHQAELKKMWDTQKLSRLSPLD